MEEIARGRRSGAMHRGGYSGYHSDGAGHHAETLEVRWLTTHPLWSECYRFVTQKS